MVSAALALGTIAVRDSAPSKPAPAVQEHLQLLRQLAEQLPGAFPQLQPLRDANPDLDFLSNVAHLQLHRRSRAFARLGTVRLPWKWMYAPGCMKCPLLLPGVFEPAGARPPAQPPSTTQAVCSPQECMQLGICCCCRRDLSRQQHRCIRDPLKWHPVPPGCT